MRIPKSLETLVDHGVINQVLRPLMSGKEAQIYLVVADGQVCAAKIYKDAQNRSFKNRADYLEGRKVRNSRDRRAIAKGTKYGKGKDEDAWKSAEVDMIYRLADAGVRVPQPYMFIDGVLLMELVSDYEGNPAPRLGDYEFTPDEATEIYHFLLHQVTLMLSAGVVHGDLSEFNVLMGADGPVVIDFPQSINAAGNNNARALLIRDVENLHRFLARWVPGARRRPYAEELWSLYESNRLTPETQLKGSFKQRGGPVDTSAVLELIGDANRDEARRRRAVGQSTAGVEGTDEPQVPMRRREVVIEKPAPRSRQANSARPGGGRGQGARSDAGTRRPRRGDSGSRSQDESRGGDRRGRAEAGPRDSRKNSGPKRGDNIQNSTYVSPEARKSKSQSLSLTPRGEERKLAGKGAGEGRSQESKGGDPGRRRRRRPSGAESRSPSTTSSDAGASASGGTSEGGSRRRRRRPRRSASS